MYCGNRDLIFCTFFLDKKSTKKVKALPMRLPRSVTGVYWDLHHQRNLPGAALQPVCVSGLFSGRFCKTRLFYFFKLVIFIKPENSIPLARLLTLRQCRRLRIKRRVSQPNP
jgi:hypothetical protein